MWQAQYWISEVRDKALLLACRHRGLALTDGRGYDELPEKVLNQFEDTLLQSVDRDELLRALGKAVDVLLREAEEARELAGKVEVELRQLASSSFAQQSGC